MNNNLRGVMGKFKLYLKAATFIALLLFCSCFNRMDLADAGPWLESKKAAPEIDISGIWQSEKWGYAVFFQNDSTVTGTLGDCVPDGAIDRKEVYFLLSDKGKVYYFAHLTLKTPKILSGKYSQDTYVGQDPNHWPITLIHIERYDLVP